MILGDPHQHIEVQSAALGDGDFVVTVRAGIRGFTGVAESIVVGAEWFAFLRDLRSLEQARKGVAWLRSSASDEFRLRLFATDPAGHMAVEGTLSDCHRDEESVLTLHFGPVTFDPSLLPSLVAELTSEHAESSDR